MEFINSAPNLKILDISGRGRDRLNFEIQIEYPADFMGERREEEDGNVPRPPAQCRIKIVDLDEKDSVLHEANITRTEEAGKLFIFHNKQERKEYAEEARKNEEKE